MDNLPVGQGDHQQTGGTYGQLLYTRLTGTGTQNTGENKGVVEKLPGGHGGDHHQTGGTSWQQGHTGVTGTGTHDTGENKGVMEKLPGDQQTGGTYGQQEHTGTTAIGTHGTDGTGEKKGIIDKIKDNLPGQH